ncbi:G2/M phase-specific E3 ubiquitin-protein ligase-like [Oppia nitens]|uniref:G2/M phase-specific E3 ubiquitin-protein ligase-like n=1 Tax=Oppia nitens TaxID=1686743 RepID=UPI0023DB079F|nr:G2/M phase-specific E3 ubiquitin-protein ligase-like [Oppia nitens]
MAKTKTNKRKREVMDNNKEEDNKPERPKCIFCGYVTKNKYFLGKLMTRGDISAHYYCILFSPGLQQNGRIDEGFKGFLEEDIQKEVRRGRQLFCTYCHKRGAVIGCYRNDCRVVFHLPCGLIHDSYHSFHDPKKNFPSYCIKHRSIQRTDPKKESTDDLCANCREQVVCKPTPKTLWTPCCGHWLHRECVIKQAYHQGKHHFKCPNCNNRDEFIIEMKDFGIHVPSRDASWEDGNNFADLYDRSHKCSAEMCFSKKGREYNGDNHWELFACDGCGSQAIHGKCGNLKSDEWLCAVCLPIFHKDNDTNASKKLRVQNDN